MCIYTYMCVCMYIYIYIYTCVCIYIHTYMQHTIILHLKTRLHVAQVGVEPARGCRGMAPSPPPCSRCIRICIPIYTYIYI